MNRKQLESKVRKLMRDAGQRKVWQKTLHLLKRFSKEFGKEERDTQSDHVNLDQTLRIYTGKGHIQLERNCGAMGSEWIIVNMVDFSAPGATSTLFLARVKYGYDPENPPLDKAEALRYLNVSPATWIYVAQYRPGQWERVLVQDEAERLLKAEWDIRRTLEERKKKEAERSQPLTEAEKKLAADFGIKV